MLILIFVMTLLGLGGALLESYGFKEPRLFAAYGIACGMIVSMIIARIKKSN